MAYQIRKVETSKPFKPERSAAYRAFLRKQRCISCSAAPEFEPIQVAHTGPHGTGIKASDFDAVPLCHKCHVSANDSYHALGEGAWLKRHGFKLEQIRAALRKRFELSKTPVAVKVTRYDPIPF